MGQKKKRALLPPPRNPRSFPLIKALLPACSRSSCFDRREQEPGFRYYLSQITEKLSENLFSVLASAGAIHWLDGVPPCTQRRGWSPSSRVGCLAGRGKICPCPGCSHLHFKPDYFTSIPNTGNLGFKPTPTAFEKHST